MDENQPLRYAEAGDLCLYIRTDGTAHLFRYFGPNGEIRDPSLVAGHMEMLSIGTDVRTPEKDIRTSDQTPLADWVSQEVSWGGAGSWIVPDTKQRILLWREVAD